MRSTLPALCVLTALCAGVAVGGPPGDYGDAPVGNNGAGVNAYPGVVARWDTTFNHHNTVFNPQRPQGSWLNTSATCWAGVTPPTVRNDSTMSPALPENDCAPLILVYAPGPNPLAEIEVGITTSNGHNPNNPVYLNIWIDQNRDGQWKDGYLLGTPVIAWNLEWCVEDVPVMLPAGVSARVNTGGIRLENPTASVWVRVMVTEEPVGAAHRGPAGSASWFWDSTMNAAHAFHGEIEDHLLNFQTGAPPFLPQPGIWYRNDHNNPPTPFPPPKPACDVFYKGPWRVFPPKCPVKLRTPLTYSSTERAGGCTAAPALWGMYGLKQIVGAPAPMVGLGLPAPVGSVAGAVAVVCPPPTGAAGLPPAVFSEGPLMNSMTLPVASLTGGQIIMESCYAWPPKRYRVWRAFFHTITCGSVHVSRTVFTPAATGITLAEAVVGGGGQSADYCDFIIGGLEEEFVDNEAVPLRPFPDPDFTDYTFLLHSPTSSEARLDNDDFTTAPASLLLRNASYLVTPTIPQGMQASSVELMHRGFATMTLTATNGETFSATLPPTTGWEPFSLDLPPDFVLQSLFIDAPLTAHIDELFIDLFDPGSEPFLPCPPDLGRQGGLPGADGLLNNNDFIVFIDFFFNADARADMGVQGGVPGQDGLFDNNDFVVFIDLFFTGCDGG